LCFLSLSPPRFTPTEPKDPFPLFRYKVDTFSPKLLGEAHSVWPDFATWEKLI
jgi:hypothetical protein